MHCLCNCQKLSTSVAVVLACGVGGDRGQIPSFHVHHTPTHTKEMSRCLAQMLPFAMMRKSHWRVDVGDRKKEEN